jgi:phosphotransferase family enzyme
VTAPATHRRAATQAAARFGPREIALVRVNVASLWRAGDLAIRVAPLGEAADIVGMAKLASDRGIPTAVPLIDRPLRIAGLDVTIWRWLDATDSPVEWRRVGEMMRVLHGIRIRDAERAGLKLDTVVDVEGARIRDRLRQLDGMIDRSLFSHLADCAERLLAGVDGTGHAVLHGDLNPGNVMSTAAGPVLLDWELARTGAPEWDHVPLLVHVRRFQLGRRSYVDFASGYGRNLIGDPRTEALCRLRELSITLGQLRRAVFGSDPVDREEANVRVRYWTHPRAGAALRWTPR